MKNFVVDFESFYSDRISVSTQGNINYMRDADAYIVAAQVGEEVLCGTIAEMGSTMEQLIKDPQAQIWAANSNFDQGWTTKYWGPSANDWKCILDLGRFHQMPGNLAMLSKVALGKPMDKSIRDEMRGVHYEELTPERQQAVQTYCANDVIISHEILEALPPMSSTEDKIAAYTRMANRRGININVELVEQDKTKMEAMRFEAFKAIPWHADEKPLSYPALQRWCVTQGIPVPASTAKTDEDCADLMSEHPALNDVLFTMRRFRKANALLKKAGTLLQRVSDDGVLPMDILYCGAPHTRRWSSKGFNVQNLDKAPMKVTDTLSVWTRNWLIPPPGHEFLILDFCVAPQSRVLKSDMTWVSAGELQVGDELVGFPEDLTVGKRNSKQVPCDGRGKSEHKFQRTKVVSIKVLERPSLRITTTEGIVECSDEHYWVSSTKKQGRSWKQAKDFVPGDSIATYAMPWETDLTPDGQWLAGLFDGEGWVSSQTVALGQKPGLVLDKAFRIATQKGYAVTLDNHRSVVQRLRFTGRSALKALGSLRPVRLLPKAPHLWEGRRTWGKCNPPAEILKIEKLGVQSVVAIGTDSKTLIVEGLLSHNCQVEPRVLNWLCGNDAMMEALRYGFSYYEAYYTASRGWKGEKGTLKAELRKLAGGGAAEGIAKYTKLKNEALGCLAEGTLILTDRGYVAIDKLSKESRVWDGDTWVTHGGVISKGAEAVISVGQEYFTADHEIYTSEHTKKQAGMLHASEQTAAMAWRKTPGSGWADLWKLGRAVSYITAQEGVSICRVLVSRLWGKFCSLPRQFAKRLVSPLQFLREKAGSKDKSAGNLGA